MPVQRLSWKTIQVTGLGDPDPVIRVYTANDDTFNMPKDLLIPLNLDYDILLDIFPLKLTIQCQGNHIKNIQVFNSLRPSDAYMRRQSNHHCFR